MWIWIALFFITITSNIYAANPYKLGEVDFFHDRFQSRSLNEENKSFDWSEPSIASDGKVSSYIPPAPMLTLLEDPSPQNARTYLDWQKHKIEKIIKAQEAIDQVINEGHKS